MIENFWILDKILLKYVPWCLIDNMAALVQKMAWCRSGVKPLSVAMMFYWRIYASLADILEFVICLLSSFSATLNAILPW